MVQSSQSEPMAMSDSGMLISNLIAVTVTCQ
jgi:hypothetical protein